MTKERGHRAYELRAAVKAAERRVEDEWRSAPKSLTVDSPEMKAYFEAEELRKRAPWKTRPPLHPLDAARGEARQVARDELRARWAKEDADAAAEKVALPHHITRFSEPSLKTCPTCNGTGKVSVT